MKRTGKPVFFIVAILILALTYTTIFGVSYKFGDRTDTIIRGAHQIRTGIDIRGGVDVTFGPKDESILNSISKEQLSTVKDVISRRMINEGITDYEVYEDNSNKQVIARFPWKSGETEFNADQAINELGRTAMIQFRKGDQTLIETKTDADGNDYTVPTGELVIDGTQVQSAKVQSYQDSATQKVETVVLLTLDDSGKEAFKNATTELAGKGQISIWLDNQFISAPQVNDAITDGIATISNSAYSTDPSQANELADLINSGALPFSIEVKSNGSLDPTLGEKSLDIMVLGGIIAFALISLFMVFYYRLPGFVAVISLLGQVAGSIAVISRYFGVFNSFTLTLPGIAGIILSIGMGVDANVITAERIKEEIRSGKTIDGAVKAGGENSFWAIFDGNITVIIVSIILMGCFGPSNSFWGVVLSPILRWFPVSTTGAIYAFGYTLFAGIIFNFIMGVVASRLMLTSLIRFRAFRKPWLLGGERV